MNRLSTIQLASKKLHASNAMLMAAVSGWFALVLPSLPEEIPVHWGPSGPNRWGSPHEMWIFLGVMLMNTAIMVGAGYFIARGKERDLSNVDESLRLAARTALDDQKRLGVRMTEWMFLAINLGMAFMWVVAVRAGSTGSVDLVNHGVMALMAWMILTIIGPIVVGVRRGLHNQKKIRDILPADAEDGWIAGGAFYYAPEDERLWVEKRLGWGWTINFAKPASWWVLSALVGLPLLVTIAIIALAT